MQNVEDKLISIIVNRSFVVFHLNQDSVMSACTSKQQLRTAAEQAASLISSSPNVLLTTGDESALSGDGGGGGEQNTEPLVGRALTRLPLSNDDVNEVCARMHPHTRCRSMRSSFV